MTHPRVPHPSRFLDGERRANNWLMERLATVFGSPWTVYAFLIIPLIAEYVAVALQNMVFFLASGWIQLWALPLLNYTQNQAERQRAAKADADHQALVHIATVVDDLQARLTGGK